MMVMNQLSIVLLVLALWFIWYNRTSDYSGPDSTYTGGDFGIVERGRF